MYYIQNKKYGNGAEVIYGALEMAGEMHEMQHLPKKMIETGLIPFIFEANPQSEIATPNLLLKMRRRFTDDSGYIIVDDNRLERTNLTYEIGMVSSGNNPLGLALTLNYGRNNCEANRPQFNMCSRRNCDTAKYAAVWIPDKGMNNHGARHEINGLVFTCRRNGEWCESETIDAFPQYDPEHVIYVKMRENSNVCFKDGNIITKSRPVKDFLSEFIYYNDLEVNIRIRPFMRMCKTMAQILETC